MSEKDQLSLWLRGKVQDLEISEELTKEETIWWPYYCHRWDMITEQLGGPFQLEINKENQEGDDL